jgi:sugar/nucleoside kinase (ribokinase family)
MTEGRTRLDVCAASDFCVDLMLTGNVRPRFAQVEQIIGGYALELGGSANIFASQMAKLGANAGVAGKAGDDVFGRFALARLAESGVDTTGVRTVAGLRTGLGVALVENDDRAILTYPGTITAAGPDDLPADPLRACRHWHVASFFLLSGLRPHWRAWLERCKQAGVTTSLDPNWDPEERWEGVLEILPFVDVFLCNAAEAAALSGESDPSRAARSLASRGPLAVVKCGEHGAVAARDRMIWTADALAVDPADIVDTVGAGDNFDAGFVRAWMLGRDVPDCLDLGQRCAAASLTAAGGIAGQLVCEDSYLTSGVRSHD